MPPPRFSVRDIQQTIQLTGYIITVTTDVPCNLYMRWTLDKPRTHKDPVLRRGVYYPQKVRFCFVEYDDNWQEEEGDTLVHTFIKLGWPECQTRWFYFWGFIGGVLSPSESPLFEKHFKLPPMIGPFYLQLQATDWAYYLHYYVSGQTYLTAHSAPEATTLAVSSTRFCYQGYGGVNKYTIRRKPIYFDTSVIPADAFLYGAVLIVAGYWSGTLKPNICLLNAPDLHVPPIKADYGYIRTLTTNPIYVLLPTDVALSDPLHFKIGSVGLGTINRTGITKWAFRTSDDVAVSAPTTSFEGVYIEPNPEILIVTYYLPS